MTFAEGDQTGPVAALLQPFDLSADRGSAGFDATMVGAGDAVAGQLGCMRWLVGKQLRVRTQGSLTPLQRQDIIADSLDHACGDAARADAGVGRDDSSGEREPLRQFRRCGDPV